ncbi:MAG: hypothetical protein ING22_03975, partial [Burkholderiales bacterium]|nr:hypothetical protein [Burkholderiales bacterium]
MSQANHEPSSILPATERRIIPFPRRHLRRPDVPIVSIPEKSAHFLPKVAAAGGDDGDDGYGKRRKRARLRLVKTDQLPSPEHVFIIYQIRRRSDGR